MKHLGNGSSINGRNGLNNYHVSSVNELLLNNPMTPNFFPSMVQNGTFPQNTFFQTRNSQTLALHPSLAITKLHHNKNYFFLQNQESQKVKTPDDNE